MRLPADQWVEVLNDAKEFEVDGAVTAFSSWRVEGEDPLDVGNIEVADGINVRAGQLVLDSCITDESAARLLENLPGGGLLLRFKFLREREPGEWGIEDKFDPIRMEGGAGPSSSSHGTQGLAS